MILFRLFFLPPTPSTPRDISMGLRIIVADAAVVFLTSVSLVSAQPSSSLPLSPRVANYRIAVSLDPEKKTLTAEETLRWHNASTDSIHELRLHLYLNAFKDRNSTFFKESGRSMRESDSGREGWGSITVNSMKTADGLDLLPGMEFIHPDDDNADDQTVVRVPLAKPVPPKGDITLAVGFGAQLPHVIARTGYHQDFFMIGQWFPKIGVYEQEGERLALHGGWNCHQFHAATEFYADFGVYDVTITVPSRFAVGATGEQLQESTNNDGTKTVMFHAEDVHDFAWTASPNAMPVHDTWRDVRITVLMQPQRKALAWRYLSSAKIALEYFDAHVGLYPYHTLTIVDPAYGASAAGGMEYPTLITGDAMWGIGQWIRLQELVTVHEFGHQYWYGMVANNEFEEAWLDEGITQYYESRIMDESYGEQNSVVDFFGLHVGDFETSRLEYTGLPNPKIAPIATFVWKFPQRRSGSLTYGKTAVFLTTLDRLIGRAAMDTVMKTFFARWRFKHPCGRDFVSVVNEVVPRMCGNRFGPDMNWFFDQVLYGTDICDYELTSIQNSDLRKRAEGASHDSMHKASYESHVFVSRLGEVCMPVTIAVRFEDGSETREEWDGKARTKDLTFQRNVPVVKAEVDPDHVLAIDINYINNAKTVEPKTSAIWKYTISVLFWIQNVFHVLAVFG